MPKARLVINKVTEIITDKPVVSIGRATDNVVPIPHDSNISRYHAEIEKRGDEFWLIELGSSNGTTLNGEKVEGEIPLKNGDQIVLGGSSKIDFAIEADAFVEEKPAAAPAAAAAPSPAAAPKPEPPPAEKSKLPLLLGIAAVAVGLALIFAVAAGLFYFTREQKCESSARIVSPEPGDTLTEETEVKAKVQGSECVKRVIFLLDGEEFASAASEPYTAMLDPKQFPDLADGLNHNVTIVIEDKKGNKTPQGDVLLAFETLATPTPTPEVTDSPEATPTPKVIQKQGVTAIEAQEMAKRTVKQFSGNSAYKFDPQFLQELQKRTTEYAAEGYFTRAQQYRDVINVAFIQEQNLDPALGYLLAMSRSRFNPQKQGSDEGLWRMSNEFATANAFNGMCGMETLSDPSQNCAAKASSLYMKNLVLNVFEGDTVYAVAAYGMSPGEAAAWKSTLPPNREDFWKVIKSPKQREEVLRFFAAALVAENPQKFGLKKDRPLSELYRNIMQ